VSVNEAPHSVVTSIWGSKYQQSMYYIRYRWEAWYSVLWCTGHAPGEFSGADY